MIITCIVQITIFTGFLSRSILQFLALSFSIHLEESLCELNVVIQYTCTK